MYGVWCPDEDQLYIPAYDRDLFPEVYPYPDIPSCIDYCPFEPLSPSLPPMASPAFFPPPSVTPKHTTPKHSPIAKSRSLASLPSTHITVVPKRKKIRQPHHKSTEPLLPELPDTELVEDASLKRSKKIEDSRRKRKIRSSRKGSASPPTDASAADKTGKKKKRTARTKEDKPKSNSDKAAPRKLSKPSAGRQASSMKMDSAGAAVTVVWTLEQERILDRAVKTYGLPPNWDFIADLVNSAPASRYHRHSRHQCLQRWALLSASTSATTPAPPATSTSPSFPLVSHLQRNSHYKQKGKDANSLSHHEHSTEASGPIGPTHPSHLQVCLAVGSVPSKPSRTPLQVVSLRTTSSTTSPRPQASLRPPSMKIGHRIPMDNKTGLSVFNPELQGGPSPGTGNSLLRAIKPFFSPPSSSASGPIPVGSSSPLVAVSNPTASPVGSSVVVMPGPARGGLAHLCPTMTHHGGGGLPLNFTLSATVSTSALASTGTSGTTTVHIGGPPTSGNNPTLMGKPPGYMASTAPKGPPAPMPQQTIANPSSATLRSSPIRSPFTLSNSPAQQHGPTRQK